MTCQWRIVLGLSASLANKSVMSTSRRVNLRSAEKNTKSIEMAQFPWPLLLMYLWSSGRIMWTLLLIHVNPSCTVAGEWQSSARNDDEGSVEWRRMFMCFQWTVNLRHVHYKQTSELQNMFPNVNNVRQWRRSGWGREILRVHISHHWHNCLTWWTSLTFSNTRRWRFETHVVRR